MKSLKAKLRKPVVSGHSGNSGHKDDWTKVDQRIWHCVAVNQPVKLASKLSKHDNINVNKLCPPVGYSLVHYAAAKGLDDCLNILLAHKADVSSRDATGATPLHASARYGHKGTTSKLLASRTVNVNSRDYNQCTALHFAAFEGHLDCVKLIADEKDCEIHSVDKEGRTALMVASAMGRLHVCEELIKRGININHKDSSSLQHTALTLASEAGHADIARLLCENGADYNYKLTDGRAALDVARSRSRRTVVDALHIIQLTEAAKKSESRPPMLSTSSRSSSIKPEEHSDFETPHTPPAHQVSQKKPNHAHKEKFVIETLHDEEKPHEAKNPVDLRSPATMSIYNDSKANNLYDRDVSIYDSKSTLASLSSLDVTIPSESNKSTLVENSVSLLSSQNGHEPKQDPKIEEELLKKEQHIVSLEAQLRDANNKLMQMDELKASNAKYKMGLFDAEKSHAALAEEYNKLKSVAEEAATQIKHLRKDNKKLSDHEVILSETQSKLFKLQQVCGSITAKNEELNKYNGQLSNQLEENKELCALQILGLKTLLKDIGKPMNDEEDFQAILHFLRNDLLQCIADKHAQDQNSDREKIELQTLQVTLSEKKHTINDLQSKVKESHDAMEQNVLEKRDLSVAIDELKSELQQLQQKLLESDSTVSHLKEDLLQSNEQLKSRDADESNLADAKEKLNAALLAIQTHNDDRKEWEIKAASLQKKLDGIHLKYNEAKQTEGKLEKMMSELRVERNQGTAKIKKLENELQKTDHKRKDLEVEINRIRQQLTDSNQKCFVLEEEVNQLQKVSKQPSNRPSSPAIYDFLVHEHKKMNKVQEELDKVCEHLTESERKYKTTIAVYRRHLLQAVKGELNPDALAALRNILQNLEQYDIFNS
ncbi:uncharacterized protein LOC143462058 [Clavelina lepadiformis]|uniref:uncharacterized protein LOC143462058 n=1 Tax=Clavelina lepadiformis TaxID=159417 RepID=UPI004041B366